MGREFQKLPKISRTSNTSQAMDNFRLHCATDTALFRLISKIVWKTQIEVLANIRNFFLYANILWWWTKPFKNLTKSFWFHLKTLTIIETLWQLTPSSIHWQYIYIYMYIYTHTNGTRSGIVFKVLRFCLWNLGTLTSWNPLAHSRPVTGLLYLHIYIYIYMYS